MRDEDGARMVALLDRDASDDIDFNEFRKFVCLLPQSQVRAAGACQCARARIRAVGCTQHTPLQYVRTP